MKNKIRLEAGIAGNSLEKYTFEKVKSEKIVTNDNGINTIVCSERLKEIRKCIIDNKESCWYEYVPSKTESRALVISLHGGLSCGWEQAMFSSWTKVAEREGFIVIFPTAETRRFWTVDYDKEMEGILTAETESGVYMNKMPEDIKENRDVRLILSLIEEMVVKYHIDRQKIFIHGMSMGDLMASMMGRYYGHLFAGIAGTGALINHKVLYDPKGNPINAGGRIAVVQTHMELDDEIPGGKESITSAVENNRNYWLRVNGCRPVPHITIEGDNNIAYYEGEADYVFREVKDRDHGETIDEAEIIWSNFFSGLTQGAGHLTKGKFVKGDRLSVAFCPDSGSRFAMGKITALQGKTFVLKKYNLRGRGEFRGEYLMVPITSLADIFHISILWQSNGGELVIKLEDGRKVQLAAENAVCLIDDVVTAMPVQTVMKDDRIYIPVEWFCNEVLKVYTSSCDNTIYITDHFCRVSKNMAYLMRQLLTK